MSRLRPALRSGKPLLAIALGVLLQLVGTPSCTDSSSGLAVDVELTPPAKRSFETDRGYTVVLERAYLTVGSVELFECDSAESSLLELPWGPRVAFAHSVSTPTRLGVPQVVSLTDEGTSPLSLGSFGPPPGAYCSLTLGFEPADADAEHLPDDVELVGVTLWLEGSYRADSDEPIAFSAATKRAVEGAASFSRVRLAEDERTEARLLVTLPNAEWFSGIDFSRADEQEIADAVLDNLADAVEVISR